MGAMIDLPRNAPGPILWCKSARAGGTGWGAHISRERICLCRIPSPYAAIFAGASKPSSLSQFNQSWHRASFMIRQPTFKYGMWRRFARLCEWEGPMPPEVRLLFDDVRAAPAVLSILRDTPIRKIIPQAPRRRRSGQIGREVDKGGEEGAGPALA